MFYKVFSLYAQKIDLKERILQGLFGKIYLISSSENRFNKHKILLIPTQWCRWLQGDYYIPCLVLDAEDTQPIGLWGRKRLDYIKKHCQALYITLMVSGKLNSHLVEVDNQATEMFDRLMKQLAEKEGITEQKIRWNGFNA